MSFMAKFNKTQNLFTFHTPSDFRYRKLSEFQTGERIKINALFINHKSKYGESPVAVSDHELINLPKHTLDSVSAIMHDTDAVNAINNGNVGIEIYEYVTNDGRTFKSFNWIDI